VASDGPITLPADLTPSLTSARDDEERLRGDGCLAFERVTTPPNCVYGVKGSAITIALVGDSHASHWFPAIEAVALERGWRLLTFVKVSCSFTTLVQRNLALKREYRECTTFNEATVARLNQIKPALTIIVWLEPHSVRWSPVSQEQRRSSSIRQTLVAMFPPVSQSIRAIFAPASSRKMRQITVSSVSQSVWRPTFQEQRLLI